MGLDVELGQSFPGHFSPLAPPPPPPPPSRAPRSPAPCAWPHAGGGFCWASQPPATFAHFSGSCLAAEKGLWNPSLFSQPLLNFTSILFPFQTGTSFILDFTLQRSPRALSFPATIVDTQSICFLPPFPSPPPSRP